MEYCKVEKTLGTLVNDNVKKLETLFPSVVKDGEVDFETLRELLGDFGEVDKEKYEMNWVGKNEAKRIALSPLFGKTLKYIEGDGKNENITENLYIEGDNLEVLKLLQNSYYGKIKMIYIDPPYNTGNDFIYLDNFNQKMNDYLEESGQIDDYDGKLFVNMESNGRFHSNWMSMMYARLKLAKNLLTDDGIIFISIDDNEMNNLRKICDEIFGEDNFIEQIIWKNKYGAGAKTKGFISVHEYILCYSKSNINNLTSDLSEEERKKYIKKDEKYEKYGGYRTQPLMTKSLGDRPNLVYPIIYKGNEIWPNKQWVWSKERMENALKNNDVEIRERNDGTYSVEAKKYLKDEYGNSRRGKPSSILNGPFTQEGTLEIKQLFNDKTPFEFTKPSNLIKYLISLEINDNNDKDFIILDFFSGSATTAHSVLKLNSEDKGKRKFIMVQVPEKTSEKSQAFNLGYSNICEIGKDRIRKAGDKIVEENKDNPQIKDLDIGFKVFRVENSNIKWENRINEDNQFKYNLDGVNIDDIDFMPNTKDIDVVYEILLRHYGIPLTAKIDKLDFIGERTYTIEDSIIVCLETEITQDIIDKISELEPIKVIFRDSAFGEDISLKQNSIHRLNVLIEKNNKNTTHVVEFI